jgi:transcription elongation factor Elf1
MSYVVKIEYGRFVCPNCDKSLISLFSLQKHVQGDCEDTPRRTILAIHLVKDGKICVCGRQIAFVKSTTNRAEVDCKVCIRRA